MGHGKNSDYENKLHALQIELVKLQAEWIASDARVLIIIEGRDAAGKDGMIKTLTQHMSPRETRIFAPPKPSDRESHQWYFQRFVQQLPSGDEFVVFNRSWYNRAGVERVMGFCKPAEVEEFFEAVNDFERFLIRSGTSLRKYYLDIAREEQKERLAERQEDPLKKWKNSPVDAAALENWDAYTEARDDMFRRTSHPDAPWRVVLADRKKRARLGLLRDLLQSFDYAKKKEALLEQEEEIVFTWSPETAHLLHR